MNQNNLIPVQAFIYLYWDTEEKKYYAVAEIEGTKKRILLGENGK